MRSIKDQLKTILPGVFSILSWCKQSLMGRLIKLQKRGIIPKLEKHYKNDPEVQEIISFLKSNQIEMIPYAFKKEYDKTELEVKIDTIDDLFVVNVNGNDIYFPKEMSVDYIRDSVRVGLVEQDDRSPHKYLPINSLHIGGDVAVLCGGSDGMYALQIVNLFKKIYLFEANTAWIKPIKKTLKNHLDKIEIVPLFVSDKNSFNKITLDSFFSEKREEVNYIQADIEGEELKMLKGASKLINDSSDLKLALCCYHTDQQEVEILNFLNEHNYKVATSKGYLLMWMQYPLLPPYLRRGVLYATR